MKITSLLVAFFLPFWINALQIQLDYEDFMNGVVSVQKRREITLENKFPDLPSMPTLKEMEEKKFVLFKRFFDHENPLLSLPKNSAIRAVCNAFMQPTDVIDLKLRLKNKLNIGIFKLAVSVFESRVAPYACDPSQFSADDQEKIVDISYIYYINPFIRSIFSAIAKYNPGIRQISISYEAVPDGPTYGFFIPPEIADLPSLQELKISNFSKVCDAQNLRGGIHLKIENPCPRYHTCIAPLLQSYKLRSLTYVQKDDLQSLSGIKNQHYDVEPIDTEIKFTIKKETALILEKQWEKEPKIRKLFKKDLLHLEYQGKIARSDAEDILHLWNTEKKLFMSDYEKSTTFLEMPTSTFFLETLPSIQEDDFQNCGELVIFIKNNNENIFSLLSILCDKIFQFSEEPPPLQIKIGELLNFTELLRKSVDQYIKLSADLKKESEKFSWYTAIDLPDKV